MASLQLSQFVDLLKESAKDAGVELKVDGQDLLAYTHEIAMDLQAAYGKDGWGMALVAARDAILLHAAGLVVDEAKATEVRFQGIITGALGMLIRATA